MVKKKKVEIGAIFFTNFFKISAKFILQFLKIHNIEFHDYFPEGREILPRNREYFRLRKEEYR